MSHAILKDMQVPLALLGDRTGFDGAAGGGLLRGDILVRASRVTGMRPASEQRADPAILLPKLVDPHCHLDKCHTVDRLADVGGDLSEAIAAQFEDKANWTDSDLLARAARGLQEYAESGTRLVRSHVDWGDGPQAPRSWHVLQELAQESTNVTLQVSALTSAVFMADPDYAKQAAETIPTGHALGMFVFGQEGYKTAIRNAFQQAQSLNLPLDFHVDEGLDPDLNGLETIADTALEMGHQGPVLCGHAVSLSVRATTDAARICDKLAHAGIAVAILPTTNLYLQGRNNGTPTARGLTLLHELRRAGVPVVLGADNVRDAFCPVGRHDPRYILELAIMAAHLDPPFDAWLPCITTDAAQAIGHVANHINGAQLDDLLIAKAADLSTLICGAPMAPATDYAEDIS